jgi:hypothetical protein
MKYCVTKLTTKSNSNINYIFENYPHLLEEKIKDPYFIQLLYTLIHKSIKPLNYILTIDTVQPIVNHLPENIRQHINETTYTLYSIQFKIKGNIINIKLYANQININKYIYFIQLILNMCINESTQPNAQYHITFYLTPFEKNEPSTSIDPEHVNSGFTIPKSGEIVIFRKEEWFKVFIHECFYLFCLDFNEVNIDFKKIFSVLFFIKSDFLFFESLIEFWARTINIAVVSFFTKKNISYEEFETLMEINISIEKIFSIIQMNHVLSCVHTSYDEIITKPTDYTETTNAFCYYVLPAILFSHYEQTMAWFVEHNETLLQFNKNTEHVYMFYQYIRSIYKLPVLKTNYDLNMNMSVFDIDF